MNKITIKSEIREMELVEHLLNCYYSNVPLNDIILFLAIHALANSWNMNKFDYYLRLFE